MNMPDELVVKSITDIFLKLFNPVIREFHNIPAPDANYMIVVGTIKPMLVPPFTITNIHSLNQLILV